MKVVHVVVRKDCNPPPPPLVDACICPPPPFLLGLILGGTLFYARVTFKSLIVFNFNVP